MDQHLELGRLHDHWHELRKAVDASVVTIAVVQERQKAQSEQMDRIEEAVATCTDLLRAQNGRVTAVERVIDVLKDRADANRDAAASAKRDGAKFGAAWGAFVAAVIGGIAAFFGGGK